jgi:translocator protein
MDTTNWIAAIFAMLLPNMGALSILFIDEMAKFRDWYDMLNFSTLQPPNWVFCPTWTTLYVAMGYGSYLVWRDGNGFSAPALVPLIVYAVHLLLNWAWSPIIYGLRSVKWVTDKILN